MKDRAVYRTNSRLKHNISLKLITDGKHHILNMLPGSFLQHIDHVPVDIDNPKYLGFEAHRILSEHLSFDYDYYC